MLRRHIIYFVLGGEDHQVSVDCRGHAWYGQGIIDNNDDGYIQTLFPTSQSGLFNRITLASESGLSNDWRFVLLNGWMVEFHWTSFQDGSDFDSWWYILSPHYTRRVAFVKNGMGPNVTQRCQSTLVSADWTTRIIEHYEFCVFEPETARSCFWPNSSPCFLVNLNPRTNTFTLVKNDLGWVQASRWTSTTKALRITTLMAWWRCEASEKSDIPSTSD